MPHYFNPPMELKEVGRLLEYATYDELIKQMKSDEHLFAFRMRDGYPQAAYIWDASHLSEYRSAQGIDEFYALSKIEWDKRFSYVPKRYEQKRPAQKEKMQTKEELFYQDGVADSRLEIVNDLNNHLIIRRDGDYMAIKISNPEGEFKEFTMNMFNAKVIADEIHSMVYDE